jgi:hypothetical protein
MNNKPSLFDIEAFNKARNLETETELAQIEKESQVFDHVDNNALEAKFLKVINAQKSDIDRINMELEKSMEQQKIYKNLIKKQQKEINSLKQGLGHQPEKRVTNEKFPTIDSNDTHNYKLILRNIVMLIDKKEFSPNDIVRLFKAEGFPPPSPYSRWDIKMIEQLYKKAKN